MCTPGQNLKAFQYAAFSPELWESQDSYALKLISYSMYEKTFIQ